jgi:Mycoplasma protein of unknown function, DUF285
MSHEPMGCIQPSRLFRNLQREYWVKKDIVSWNTSNDTSVPNIFHGAEASNQDISSWDVSNMTDVSYIFSDSKNFSQDLSFLLWITGNWQCIYNERDVI